MRKTVPQNKWKPLVLSFFNRDWWRIDPVSYHHQLKGGPSGSTGWALTWAELYLVNTGSQREENNNSRKKKQHSLKILAKFSNHFLFSSCFSSPSSPCCSTPVWDICLFKGRNNRSSSIRRRELDLIILKRTWKAEVVTVCLYWIEQSGNGRALFSVLRLCVHMPERLCTWK